MESNQFIRQGKRHRTIFLSGKLLNDDDGLKWPTAKVKKGLFSVSPGFGYAFRVVNQIANTFRAEILSRRQAGKTGQMISCC